MRPETRAVRPVRLPPADFDKLEIPVRPLRERLWCRVHQSAYGATFFSVNRNHRFSHPDCPFTLLYLGADTATCLFERFGDLMYDQKMAIPNAVWKAQCMSAICLPKLRVCNLTEAHTLSALNVDLSALTNNNLKVPQAWGLAIQRHPANFDAIQFKSRFNDWFCLAVFNRDDMEKQVGERRLESLVEHGPAVDWLHDHRVSLY
jgi:hypothetical protein